MIIVGIASQKGGTGKSSIAIHLAVEAALTGKSVAIVDLDPQTSTMSWKDDRQSDDLLVVSLQPSRLPQFLKAAETNGADFVFLDSGPNAELTMCAADAAELLIIPVRPSIFDLKAISTTAKIVRTLGKPAAVVLNAVPTRSPLIVADATRAVATYKLATSPVVVHQRSVFGKAIAEGMVAREYEPGCKGADEITALYEWILNQLNQHQKPN
ncbi:AAA family ATPase [Beijerinckia sp. L45]|uniref:nucleotide-binding protein n=1 Tax=Beijerinckia sp. L45 TaxID=1641855 RepID=UPI00131DB409|nr:AAA family ATPase [Beijerinckia sp. L45]